MSMNHTVKSSSEKSHENKENESAKKSKPSMSFELESISTRFAVIVIIVEPELRNLAYKQAIDLFKRRDFSGFSHNNIPDEYIEENFKSELEEKFKDHLFRYNVTQFLFDEITHRKIHISNYH